MSKEIQIAHIEYSINTKSLDIFTIGCDAHPKCKGCYNCELWNFNLGGMYIYQTFNKLLELNTKFDKLIDKIIIVGGDPVDGWNKRTGLDKLLIEIKNKINKPIFLFTRHSLDNIPQKLKDLVDYIKVGEYISELTTDNNIQYGIKLATSNQKIYRKEKEQWV